MDYSFLIDFLRLKHEITSLEKDILDTWNELQKNPFDMVLQTSKFSLIKSAIRTQR